MKWFLVFWLGPIVFLGGWYWLSYYDMNFGFFMLTRQVHDLTFQIYGKALGLPPQEIPPLVARAIAVDSLVVFAIMGFRKRGQISAENISAFLDAGFTQSQLLEVLVGVSMTTLASYMYHIAGTQPDAAFQPQSWMAPAWLTLAWGTES